jgi:outer membrane receptor protein involved in Fe transport
MKAEINTGLFQYDCVGLTGPICNDPNSDHAAMQPKWRHLFRASWDMGKLVPSIGWRMIGSVTAEQLSNQTVLADSSLAQQLKLNLADKYAAWHYLDAALTYKLHRSVQATVGVNNLLDKNPPLGSGSSANDYGDGFYGTYDPYGRFVHASVQITF